MNHSLTSVPRSCRCPLIYLRKAVNFNLLRCILFPSTLREHEQSSSDEIPEAQKKKTGSMFVVSNYCM